MTNHRQGEDFDYAEVLNRIRAGSQTDNDYILLEQRVKPENHSDIPPKAGSTKRGTLGLAGARGPHSSHLALPPLAVTILITFYSSLLFIPPLSYIK